MKVRIAKKEDIEQVKKLADKYNLEYSDQSIIILAEDDDKNIKGFIALRFVPFIEPMISESSIAALMLYQAAEKLLEQMEVPIIRIFAQEKHEELFKKVGFEEIFQDYISMEKVLTSKEIN